MPPLLAAEALKRLGANLRTARLRRNLTIEEVAHKIGTGPKPIADAEKGKASTGAAVYMALLWAYDLLTPMDAIADPASDREGLSLSAPRERARAKERGADRPDRSETRANDARDALAQGDLRRAARCEPGLLGSARHRETRGPCAARRGRLPAPFTGRPGGRARLRPRARAARPKAVVEDAGALWIAKFNRPDDRWNHARIERAMLELARVCGAHTAETRLTTIGDRDALLVKRFDRESTRKGYHRARMLSALTLLRAEDTHTDRSKWSYVLLAEELRRISAQPKDDAPELFKRMCFNALIGNSDDHPRNHAVIAMENDWRLSPAYDLTPAPQISIERRDLALACGDMGRHANAGNLRSQSARFLVDSDEAEAIIDRMEQTVKDRWYDIARREGVSEKDCEMIRGAFAYEGFRLEPPKSA